MDVQRHQDHLAQDILCKCLDERILSDAVLSAYHKVPRHLFVSRYRVPGTDHWVEVTEENLRHVLSYIYQDKPLIIWGSDEDFHSADPGREVSTVSQPSLVLFLLDVLQLKKGMSVFEVGAASGWNAALMAELVGPQGRIVTSEIIEPLAEAARERLVHLGYRNVEVVEGDAVDAITGRQFDRIIFTAGADDLPAVFHEAVRPGGLILFVLKGSGGPDYFVLLKKINGQFHAERLSPCSFVNMSGKVMRPELQDFYEEDWRNLRRRFDSFLLKGVGLTVQKSSDPAPADDGCIVWRRPESTFIWKNSV